MLAMTSLNVLDLTVLIWFGALGAGFLGALTGLGGGVVIVPMLTLLFGVDIRYAIGASLVSVIATSSGAAAAYVKEGFSNIRVGMLLEIATTVGAVAGASLGSVLSGAVVAVILGFTLIYSSYLSTRAQPIVSPNTEPDPLATKLRLNGHYPAIGGWKSYNVYGVPGGFAIMFIAGTLSGLLGIGSGAVKVLAMDTIMRIPFKVSTTTSNFMIGVTAAASAGIYLNRGYIDPGLSLPVMLGVLVGSIAGTRVLARVRTRTLRILFGIVILILGIQMIYKGLIGGI
jgi:uncharacterized membrane protein YfcA